MIDQPARLLAPCVERVCSKLPAQSALGPVQPDNRQARLRDLLSELGSLYAGCTLKNYSIEHAGQREVVAALQEYSCNMANEVAVGHGIVLFGPSGTGKDHLLAALSKKAVEDHGLTVKWVYGVNLYGELRDRISQAQAEAPWVSALCRPDVLYISDPIPPRGGLSEYQASMLVRILDRRSRHRRPVWVSMNASGQKEADSLLGPSLVDRLKFRAIGAHCDWPSHRKARMVWPPSEGASP